LYLKREGLQWKARIGKEYEKENPINYKKSDFSTYLMAGLGAESPTRRRRGTPG